MKKILLLSLFLIFSYNSANSQAWEILDYPAEEGITGISAISPDTFFLVTDNGKIVRTLDGGKSWQFNQLTIGFPLEDVEFLNANLGYACGGMSFTVRTMNGGKNWSVVSPTIDTTNYLFDMDMINDSVGIIVSLTKDSTKNFEGRTFITSDFGVNWEVIKPEGIGFSEVLHDNGKYYLVSFGKLHISSDYGRTWKTVKTHDGNPGRCLTKFGNNMVIAGIKGLILYSMDEGQTWYKSSQEFSEVNFIAAAMLNKDRVFIAGTDGALYQSYNGGVRWEKMEVPTPFNFLDLEIVDNYLIGAGSKGNILRLKLN